MPDVHDSARFVAVKETSHLKLHPPISPAEITVVVQGPIVDTTEFGNMTRLTMRGLRSIRQHLPGAEIILSTWKGVDVAGLDYDKLVESADPGICLSVAPKANLNRLIVSTQAGIAVAKRRYVLKFRTDMELTGVGFLKCFGRYPACGSVDQVFGNRVVTWSWLTKVPRRSSSGLFHVSDIVHFGRTEDVRNLWDIPLYSRSVSDLADDQDRFSNSNDGEMPLAYYAAEQYIWLSSLRRNRSISLHRRMTLGAIVESEKLLAENFIVLDPEQFGARWKGGVRVTKTAWAETYSHAEWEGLYRKYCDPSISPRVAWEIPFKSVIQIAERNSPALITLYRKLYHALFPHAAGKSPVSLAKALGERFGRRH